MRKTYTGISRPLAQIAYGQYFSEKTISHPGFTGTSLWVDLQEEIVVVLLSNRVHPPGESITDSQKNRMSEIRPHLHNAVMRDLLEIKI